MTTSYTLCDHMTDVGHMTADEVIGSHSVGTVIVPEHGVMKEIR